MVDWWSIGRTGIMALNKDSYSSTSTQLYRTQWSETNQYICVQDNINNEMTTFVHVMTSLYVKFEAWDPSDIYILNLHHKDFKTAFIAILKFLALLFFLFICDNKLWIICLRFWFYFGKGMVSPSIGQRLFNSYYIYVHSFYFNFIILLLT